MKSLTLGRQFQLSGEHASKMPSDDTELDYSNFSIMNRFQELLCCLFIKAAEWFDVMYTTGPMPVMQGNSGDFEKVLDKSAKTGNSTGKTELIFLAHKCGPEARS